MNKFNWYVAPKQEFLKSPASEKKENTRGLFLIVGFLCLPLLASIVRELSR